MGKARKEAGRSGRSPDRQGEGVRGKNHVTYSRERATI